MTTRPQTALDTIHRARWTQHGKRWRYGVIEIRQGPGDTLWRLKDILPADTQRTKSDPRAWKTFADAQLHVERHYVVLVVQNNHQPSRKWRNQK